MTDENLAPVINNDAGEDYDVFDDSESVEAEAEVEKEEKVDKVDSKAKPKKEAEEEDGETTAPEPKSVPVAALKDERKKRQDAEKELDRLKKDYESLKSQPAKTEPVPDNEFDALVKVSTRHLKKIHSDYPEMEKLFMELVSREKGGKLEIKNLELYEKYRESEDPAEFAYTYAKTHKESLDRSSPEFEKKFKEKLEKEILADLKKRKLISAELPDLTSTAASGQNTDDPEATGPDDGVWDD